jgi:hypothetical protein
MKRAAEEMDSDWWADDILELCSEDSFYFTAFRAHVLIEGYGRVKSTSVPFINRLWFLPVIIGYITAKYLIGLVTRSEPQLSGHVFCCHSTAPYKTEAFFELVDHFHDSGEETTLFTVGGAKQLFQGEFPNRDLNTVTFSDCFTTVSPVTVISAFATLWRISNEMGRILDIDSLWRRVIVFNFLVVEFMKYDAIEQSNAGIQTFHSYAPMPYQLKSVDSDRMFIYQHGVEADDGDRSFSIPKYAPLNYVIWGDVWLKEFKQKAHPESAIYPIGSPRYDLLAERPTERNVDIDVLFVAGSHVIGKTDFDESAYRELVESVVELCENNDWKLAIKLHPVENSSYYEQLGCDQYIVDEDNISILLLRSDVAVTDLSSSFIESLALGTPMVVTQSSSDRGYGSYASVPGIEFPDSLSEALNTIERVKGYRIPIEDINESGFIQIGDSKTEILSRCKDVTNTVE